MATLESSMGRLISLWQVWNHPPQDIGIYMDNAGVGFEARLEPGREAMLAALQEKGFAFGKNSIWYRDPAAEHSGHV